MFSFEYKNLDYAHKLDYASSPKDQYYKHMHYFNEMLYFVGGNVDYTVESVTRHLHPGDMVFVHPGKYHFATVDKNEIYERYVIKFPNSIVPDELKERINGIGPFISDARAEEFLFKQLDGYYGHFSDDNTRTLFICKTVELLVLLTQEKNLDIKPTDSLTSAIIDYISKNIRLGLSLDKIARDLNYSESYISNTFRKEMKCPLMQYIRSKKIIAAHSLILHGTKPESAAESLGFNDYSTFYRSYLKTFGFPPSKAKEVDPYD